MRRLTLNIATLCLLLLATLSAKAQGYVDQEAVRSLIEDQRGDIDKVQQVHWQVYTVKSTNKVAALKAVLDSIPGQYDLDTKIRIVELANRVRLENMKAGRTLVI